MPFTLTVLAIAISVSLLRGGRLRHVADADLRLDWLLFVGVALQVAVDLAAARNLLPDAGLSGWTLLLLSQLLVIGFLVGNRRLPGVWWVAAGLALNAIVMAANRAMPVDPVAIAALGIDGATVPPGKHTLLTPDTHLALLADIIPVPWLRSILSVGDLVLAVGLLPMTHTLMTGAPSEAQGRTRGLRPTPALRRSPADQHPPQVGSPTTGLGRPQGVRRRRTES